MLMTLFYNWACRFHPACVDISNEVAKKLEHYICSECSADEDVKKPQNSVSASPADDAKVRYLMWSFRYM